MIRTCKEIKIAEKLICPLLSNFNEKNQKCLTINCSFWVHDHEEDCHECSTVLVNNNIMMNTPKPWPKCKYHEETEYKQYGYCGYITEQSK